ncbi:MAG: response regulator, partial [Alphaproteobacteria bacterium]|nr:response regulator [Alphaproteobacteria bacterium]
MSSPNTIFVFCDRRDQAARLTELIQQAGFEARVAADPASMSGGALALKPAAVLIDNADPSNVNACLAAVKRLFLDGRLSCPSIFVGDTEDVPSRLEAVRSGCSSFLARPVEPMALIDTIDNLVAPETDPLRVLIVDDSRTSAAHHAGILEDAGMVTRIVNDPMTASSQVEAFGPDLILLDLVMPQCDGMEVAALIRQLPAYDSVPIVFLSGESSRSRQLDALDSGGDDFLTKPIDGAHLVRSARSRGMRFRRLARLIHRDAMTGLFSHSACLDKLKTELAFADEQNVIAFAMADIDRGRVATRWWAVRWSAWIARRARRDG